MAPGLGFRTHAWGVARRGLLPVLPLEVVRLRMGRARALGLDYPTYARIRATTGRDVTAFLFSSNALRLFAQAPDLAELELERLARSVALRLLAAHPPLSPPDVARRAAGRGVPFAAHAVAPHAHQPPGEVARALRSLVREACLPRDAVLVIGDTPFERAWSAQARLAGYLPAERWAAQA